MNAAGVAVIMMAAMTRRLVVPRFRVHLKRRPSNRVMKKSSARSNAKTPAIVAMTGRPASRLARPARHQPTVGAEAADAAAVSPARTTHRDARWITG